MLGSFYPNTFDFGESQDRQAVGRYPQPLCPLPTQPQQLGYYRSSGQPDALLWKSES